MRLVACLLDCVFDCVSVCGWFVRSLCVSLTVCLLGWRCCLCVFACVESCLCELCGCWLDCLFVCMLKCMFVGWLICCLVGWLAGPSVCVFAVSWSVLLFVGVAVFVFCVGVCAFVPYVSVRLLVCVFASVFVWLCECVLACVFVCLSVCCFVCMMLCFRLCMWKCACLFGWLLLR